MTAKELAEKAVNIAKNYKTLYVMGCFGSPLNATNKVRFCSNHAFNKKAARTAMIKAASEDTFGFDCVNLIKGILWGWNGDKSKTHGGAKYVTNGVPDINADGMIARCKNVTTNFSNIEVGEAVWCSGHIGVYIGDGLAVECTPAWKNCVQITAVGNIGTKSGYDTRRWTKHGKLPYVTYTGASTTGQQTTPAATQKPVQGTTAAKIKVDAARSFAEKYGKTYTVNTAALNMRVGPGTNKAVIRALTRGEKVICYGFYSMNGATTWLYVQDKNGQTGHVSSKYLV